MGNTSLCSPKCQAIADTMISFISAPIAVAKIINKKIGAKGKYLLVDCSKLSTLPAVVFTIGGTSFTLNDEDYVLKVRNFNVYICFTGG